jgi:hypothetical protein
MRCVGFLGSLILFSVSCAAQSTTPSAADFSVTLERGFCEGVCPWYSVTILNNGSVRYEGRAYVRVKGVRKTKIPISQVRELIERLQNEDYFRWQDNIGGCVDYPDIKIMVTLDRQRKEVREGCLTQGRILELAKQVDNISGSKIWVGTTLEIHGGHFVRDENGEWRVVKPNR